MAEETPWMFVTILSVFFRVLNGVFFLYAEETPWMFVTIPSVFFRVLKGVFFFF